MLAGTVKEEQPRPDQRHPGRLGELEQILVEHMLGKAVGCRGPGRRLDLVADSIGPVILRTGAGYDNSPAAEAGELAYQVPGSVAPAFVVRRRPVCPRRCHPGE